MTLNGLAFKEDTPPPVARILTEYARSPRRIRIWYGDRETGRSWEEEWDVVGTVGVSMGPMKVPLLLRQSNSSGGGAIMTDCVLKIVDTRTKKVLYVHPLFHQPKYDICKSKVKGYVTAVTADGKVVANFKTELGAWRYIDFMTGKTMSKGGRRG